MHRLCRVLLAAPLTILVSGCGITNNSDSSALSNSTALSGRIMGGQQPVSGSSIQLYAAGATGNASAAVPLLLTPVVTDSSGNFSITGDYTCPANSAPVYLVASGGNPGLSNIDNPALVLVDALGSCTALSASTFINVNEVTTAAAAWALAPFASSVTQLGTTSTNLVGLNNAFLTAANLADPSTGVSPSSHTPSNAKINSNKLYSLADVLATCINSDGTAPCTTLFSTATPPSAAAPTDTFQAALDIVSHPGHNVAAIFNLITPTPPFAGALTTAPPDWTLAIKYTGGGMNSPTGIGVDATGNVWVANYFSTVSQFSPTGQPIFPTGITGNGLAHSYGLAIDASNNAWVPNEDTSFAVNGGLGSVSVINPSGLTVAGPNGFTAGGLNYPVAVTVDSNATTWVVNYGMSTVSLLSSDGTPLSGASGFGKGHLAFPVAVAVDSGHNAWVANQSSSTVSRISPDGSQITDYPCCDGASGIAIDQNSNVWIANYYGNSVSQIASDGTIVSNGAYTGGGIDHPQGIAIDGSGSVWLANYRGNALTQLAGSNTASPGAPISPADGWGPDARINLGFALAIDASGNLWTTGFGDNTLTQFVGLATPVKTPQLGPPQLP